MTHRILRAADHRRMPWKNGRGETVEVAVHPPGAGLDDFGWRVSMAGVTEDGDFSIFPGIDRSLAVLSGTAVDLQIAGQGDHRLTPDSAALIGVGSLALPRKRSAMTKVASMAATPSASVTSSLTSDRVLRCEATRRPPALSPGRVRP